MTASLNNFVTTRDVAQLEFILSKIDTYVEDGMLDPGNAAEAALLIREEIAEIKAEEVVFIYEGHEYRKSELKNAMDAMTKGRHWKDSFVVQAQTAHYHVFVAAAVFYVGERPLVEETSLAYVVIRSRGYWAAQHEPNLKERPFGKYSV